MRMIDADALIKAISDFPYGYRGMIKNVIAEQPTVEERKNGKWIHEQIPSDRSMTRYFLSPKCHCSECGLETFEANFCPKCGSFNCADIRTSE